MPTTCGLQRRRGPLGSTPEPAAPSAEQAARQLQAQALAGISANARTQLIGSRTEVAARPATATAPLTPSASTNPHRTVATDTEPPQRENRKSTRSTAAGNKIHPSPMPGDLSDMTKPYRHAQPGTLSTLTSSRYKMRGRTLCSAQRAGSLTTRIADKGSL